jgi:hypothetical protein
MRSRYYITLSLVTHILTRTPENSQNVWIALAVK